MQPACFDTVALPGINAAVLSVRQPVQHILDLIEIQFAAVVGITLFEQVLNRFLLMMWPEDYALSGRLITRNYKLASSASAQLHGSEL